MSIKMDLKSILFAATLLSAGLLSACGLSQAEGKKATMVKANQDKTNSEKRESISSVSFDGTQLSLSVISTGCTGAEHFSVEHEVSEGVCHVLVTRHTPDRCRRAPFIADVKLDWTQPENCTDMQVVIDNPILVTPADGFLQKRLK